MATDPTDPTARTADDRAVPFPAAAIALASIEEALRVARAADDTAPRPGPDEGPAEALASLILLREVREQLARWESGLIETARAAGASWADLADPLGVASRQAAERRYLRLRPGAAGTTGEQRVKATRDGRAADRSVNVWARDKAADLRRLAAQVTALTDLPESARPAVAAVDRALAHDDAARLLAPLAATHPFLESGHPDLAAAVGSLTRHTDRLRESSHQQRRRD
ncbi:HSP18 transcriptional regulator [Streptomyces sp. MI02-7b]|uniref:HSP18 transcriptional regulator n=1 Tax=Streptomyces sp. MI02-7b TaxID=462941 RepID=UPI0029ABE585|nr:HSP18 transcriptional regulator [Streptomyces sp. MI02-7b]MDX3074088.1 HSP18 transcriptional regulator [Streptomyces sp. MI02-7b]